jgi:hypothetical protein
MPNVDIHLSKGGIAAGRKKIVSSGPAAAEGESLLRLTWLTSVDVKNLALE